MPIKTRPRGRKSGVTQVSRDERPHLGVDSNEADKLTGVILKVMIELRRDDSAEHGRKPDPAHEQDKRDPDRCASDHASTEVAAEHWSIRCDIPCL
ncbi:hypothetical protein BRAS3843_3350046 [Bradyrhizobium sp. STM 3843]|nr:hypothetical protein BRAS3843_3350046 [Bradyrhizobium sp. STM 3843]